MGRKLVVGTDGLRNETLTAVLTVVMVSCAPEAPLPWVSPSRCVRPCSHPDEAALARCDAHGHADASGGLQFKGVALPYLEGMLSAAQSAGHAVELSSAYRSYAAQASLYEAFEPVQPGRAARPGHSEHELGLAVDLDSPDAATLDWLGDNAWRFGFVASYPAGREKETGFRAEPWHLRFIGGDPAVAFQAQPRGSSLEALFVSDAALGESGDCSDCPLDASRSPCEDGLDAAGRCDGSVMRWCFEGAAQAVDCAATAHACAQTSGGATCAP